MTANDKCIKAGLGDIWTMVALTGVSRSTLRDWSNKMPNRFDKILKLCVAWQESQNKGEG